MIKLCFNHGCLPSRLSVSHIPLNSSMMSTLRLLMLMNTKPKHIMLSIDISYRLFCCRFRIVCMEHVKSCFDNAHICYTFKWLKETNIMLEILCQILYFMYVRPLKLNCICTWIFADTISYHLSRIFPLRFIRTTV